MNKIVKTIILKTRRQVFGHRSGNHISFLKGEGLEFRELREYTYGDDVKKIDWKITAKLRKQYVKVYDEERDLNIVISSMLSGSTFFGTDIQKKDYMIEIMAIIGFGAVRNRDFFSHILYADKFYRASNPSKKVYAVEKEIEEAVKFDVIGKAANYSGWVKDLSKRVRKKSVLVLIGDFVGDINLAVLAKKHDLIVIIVRDRFIENPKPLGEVTLVDPGYLSSFSGNVDEFALEKYTNALKENDIKLTQHLKKVGARFLKIYTDQDAYLKLLKRI